MAAPSLPLPRLRPAEGSPGVLQVPAYTDFKLHDITDRHDDGERTARHESAASLPKVSAGNRRVPARRLWGAADKPPYFHHGLFTTLREAVLADSGRRASNEERSRPSAGPAERGARVP